MYKIYFNKIVLIFLPPEKSKLKTKTQTSIFLNENNLTTFQELIESINSGNKISKIFVLTSNPRKLFLKLFRETLLIKAAGGLVLNNKNQLLMIKRHTMWDLPKGKTDKGEKISLCAIREVEEECGITKLEILKKISTSYHVYYEKNKWYIKKTCWFKMQTNDNTLPVPQLKEHITKAVWLNSDEVQQRLKRSYGNIKDIVKKHYLREV